MGTRLSSAKSKAAAVRAWTGEISLPTFLPAPPDKNPMFLEKRVYQGSSGRVYPLPFTDRIAETPTARIWKAVWLENEFLKVLMLPELGGRIHRLLDKTNNYDLIYYQPVIKPALVGLAGPWISGGIEFNWPQHHRPATFLPVEVQIERGPDGSRTVWCGDHDPMARMKGMHGVCLRPGQAVLELRVRVYNRTPMVQTFLWWANVATRVHEAYQSFFPPDVFYVADHAKRATSAYPLCQGRYYGVDYAGRAREGVPANEVPSKFVPPHCRPGSDTARAKLPSCAPNDLSWYANIPTPCSYMCMGSTQDFFGGYDHFRQAGLVHVANHHISPGKKQWTWGNHEFGYAWDRNLTEKDAQGEYGPYIELMAGVYTDNQPDFSFLRPGETKTWSQYWYPIREIGPACQANLHAAISLRADRESNPPRIRIGVAVTADHPKAILEIRRRGKLLARVRRDLGPGKPLIHFLSLAKAAGSGAASLHPANGALLPDLEVRVCTAAGRELAAYRHTERRTGTVPPGATEPPPPNQIAGSDELFLTGLHLEQYRHATRCPTDYWREALRRDPLDSRCNNALGLWHLRRGELDLAEARFRNAYDRLTTRNPNPYDAEPCYNLGLCLRYRLDATPLDDPGRSALRDRAYAAFYKSTWSQAWAGPAYHALAELDCRGTQWPAALDHLDRALRLNADNLRARNLKAAVLARLGRAAEARDFASATLKLDPLDWWARYLSGERPRCDLQTLLDLAHDCARAGLYEDAITILRSGSGSGPARVVGALPDQSWGAQPMVAYTLGWLSQLSGNLKAATTHFRQAAKCSPDYCFPARLEDIAVLEAAIRANPRDPRAPYYLGNLLYDRRRHLEAIALWERSAQLDPGIATVWRNLGIAYFNVRRRPALARKAFETAFHLDPADARLLFERDQLWKRLGIGPTRRLKELERFPRLVATRDDLSVELCALYNQTGRPEKARETLAGRRFQPWEGGEGQALAQHVRTHLLLGRRALGRGDSHKAVACFRTALTAPPNLSEAKHLLANQSDIHYWLGQALTRLGDSATARKHWREAAEFKGDFQEMSVRAFSELTYYSALSWRELGQENRARQLLKALMAYAQKLARTPAKIGYFATSLPTMLLFEDALQARQGRTAAFLEAQARLGLGQENRAHRLLKRVLRDDPSHALAADLLGARRKGDA